MKIVHVMNWYMPNMTYQENFLPAEQKNFGYEVEIVTGDKFAPKYRQCSKLKPCIYWENGVKIHRLPSLFEIRGAGLFLEGLKKKLIELAPEIVHAHGLWMLPTIQTLFYKGGNEFKLFVDEHIDNQNFIVDTIPRKIAVNLFVKSFLPILKSNVEKFLSVNPYCKWVLMDKFNIEESNIEFIPLGIDEKSYKPNCKKREKARKRLGIEEGEVVIFSVGTLEPTKDIDVLIKAVGSIAEKYKNIKLLLVGSGPEEYMNRIEKLIKEANLGEKTILPGWVSSEILPDYYNAADIAVMPGKLGCVKDILATAKPIVVCNSRATEYLVSNDNGLMFEEKNVNNLAMVLEEYISSPKKREEHGKRSLELVREQLSWKAVAKKTIEIYNDALRLRR